jgi:hypothetical protein
MKKIYSIKKNGLPITNNRVLFWHENKINSECLGIYSKEEDVFIIDDDYLGVSEFTHYLYIHELLWLNKQLG